MAELFNDAAFFDQEIGGGLAGYLQHVALMTSQDQADEAEPRVSLMTVHAAKGLEFDHVFVAGLEEGLFPSSRALEEPGGVEEERRLMYVALTRARKSLWLGHSDNRMVMGRLQSQLRSSFVDELPRECLAGDVEADHGLGYDPDDDSDFGGGDGGFVVDEFDQSQEPVQLASGLRVVHPVYGFGTVVRSQGHGLQAKATVRFDRGGEKTLILEYAGLRAVPGQEAT